MRPAEFKEQNCVYAEHQPEYLPFPMHRIPGVYGELIGCWSLNWKERLIVLFTGRVWQNIFTFNQPLQPQKLSVENPFNSKKDE